MILCLGTTPAVQRVMVFRRLVLDSVNRAATTIEGAAGKSVNVAKVLRALGEDAVATGFLGGDRGAQVRAILDGLGVEHEFVPVTANTRLCVTLIDEANGSQTELVEEGSPVPEAAHEALRQVIRRRLTGASTVVMSGTITVGSPAGLYREVVEWARAGGVLSVVDAVGVPLAQALAARPGLVKPNRAELAATVGRDLGDEAEVMAAIRELRERGAERVVVTAGAAPALAFDGSRFWRLWSPRIRAVNPIGAGDSFTAAVVGRLVRGDDLGEACRWGVAAAVADVLSPMAGEVARTEVEALVHEVLVERASWEH
jgi:tagatose 6-phosphate kinase